MLGTGVNPGFVMDVLPICMTGVQLHILTNGAAFDLKSRVATPPPRQEPA